MRLVAITSRLTWPRSPSVATRLSAIAVFAVSAGLLASDHVPRFVRVLAAVVVAALWIALGIIVERDERAREKLERQVTTRDNVIRLQKAVIAEERDKYDRFLRGAGYLTEQYRAVERRQLHEIAMLRREVWRLGGHHVLQNFESAMHQSVQEEATTDEQF